MSTTGPGKPSSRSVAAALPPARPPPMITIGLPLVRSATQYILPPECPGVSTFSPRSVRGSPLAQLRAAAPTPPMTAPPRLDQPLAVVRAHTALLVLSTRNSG